MDEAEAMNEQEFIEHYPATVDIPVQWGEQDGFGHINNAVFIRWLEASRIQLMSKLGVELTTHGVGPILAAVSCNFRLQVKFPDTVISGARITRMGRSSMGIEHAVWSKTQGAVAADGDSTVVLFDYDQQQSSPLSESLRALIAEWHPALKA